MHIPTGCPGHRKGLGKKPGFIHLIKCVLSTYITLWASLVAQTGKNLPAIQDTGVQSLGWEDPLKEMATHSSFLAWRILWTGAWWPIVHGVGKESDTTERLTHITFCRLK